MYSSRHIISRFRRDLTLGWALKAVLLAAAIAAVAAPAALGMGTSGVAALGIVVIAWFFLSYVSYRGSRLGAESASLIAAGQYEQAEQQIDESLRRFNLFSRMKMLSLHHLAMLRHAQRRFEETIELCRAILRQRRTLRAVVARSTRLMLADSLLEVGDADGAGEQVALIGRQRLDLAEMALFMVIQLDYQQRTRNWRGMMESPGRKVELAETLCSTPAARAQALMALAARHTGQVQWCDWLKGRAELLEDPKALIQWRTALRELWPQEAT